MKITFKSLLLLVLMTGMIYPIIGQEVQSTDEVQKLKQEIEALKNESTSFKPGKSGFLLRGYAHSGLQVTEDQFSFVGGSYNPLFIYKQSDRLLFESELEFELGEDGLEVGLEYANMSYLLTKTMTLRAGKLLVPFGIFVPNLHPAWINKFATVPLGVGHDGIVPSNDIGVALSGGGYLGNVKMNYAFYALNGSQLNDGVAEPEEAGRLHHSLFPDNNKGKTLGGRVGIFPLSNSSLEIGVSGMYGKVGAQGSSLEDVAALHYAFDVSYVKTLSSISSIMDFKGQYSAVQVDKANYPDHENPGSFVTFDNNSTAWFAQLSFRPALLENPVLRNLELAGRYSAITTPTGSEWESDLTQFDIGLNYWIDWRTVVKFSYRVSNSGEGDTDGHAEDTAGNAFFIHWAIGF